MWGGACPCLAVLVAENCTPGEEPGLPPSKWALAVQVKSAFGEALPAEPRRPTDVGWTLDSELGWWQLCKKNKHLLPVQQVYT